MAENTRLPTQPRDPFDRFDEAISDPRLYEADQSRYEQLRAQLRYEPQPQYEQPQYEQPQYEQPFALQYDRTEVLPEELPPHEPVPLFLSNYEEEAHQALSEYTFASGSRKKPRAGRIVTGVAVVSAIAAVLALFSIDSTRAVIFNASLGGGGGGSPPAAQLAAAMPEPAQPQRIAAPPLAAEPTGAEIAAARRTPPNALASASPTRDEIAAAYQSALKGKVAVPEPVAREASREVVAAINPAAPVAAAAPAVREPVPVTREAAPVPVRRIDPDELAVLLKRAKSLLAIGDITSARLLLERAADAQEAEAALMLAGTYDPQVLGSQDLRSVTPDPAAAKVWYQKAAQLGSDDARRRLGQLQN
jgi:TPR repeat protein